MSKFTLVPFPTAQPLPQIEINGEIDRTDGRLAIEYRLQGDLDAITISNPSSAPSRQLDLWETTCFEFFIGIPGDRQYWEFNLAPSGDWNVFHLDDYRQGLRLEAAFLELPLSIDRQPNSLVLKLAFDLSEIIPPDRDVEMAVTTVIKSTQGEMSYWALTHAGTEADFHLRASFRLRI
jgi:hypothetical protein